MIKILLLFFITALCKLTILSPKELYKLYLDSIVPSITPNFRKTPNPAYGSVWFLPNNTNPCYETSWPQFVNYTVFAIMNITCNYSTVADIAERKGAKGVIFFLDMPKYSLNHDFKHANFRGTIFALGITKFDIDIWRKFKQGQITVQFEPDFILWEKPNITIGLTGNYVYDTAFIEEFYTYLIPITASEVNIDLTFNYSYHCDNCSSYDCYSNYKYCMIDDVNHANGADMIDRTLLELALLHYTVTNNLYLSAFAIFLYEIANSCYNDYSTTCSRNILNWLKIDWEKIQQIIDSSWIKNGSNKYWDNHFLQSQLYKNNGLMPRISVGDIDLSRNELDSFKTHICEYVEFSSHLCRNSCSKNCTIDDLSNSYCNKNCQADSCFNDFEDCNTLYDFCYDAHTLVCNYSSDSSSDGNEGLSQTSVILIIVFSCVGFCWVCTCCCVGCDYFINFRKNQNHSNTLQLATNNNHNPSRLFPLSPPLPPSPPSPPSLPLSLLIPLSRLNPLPPLSPLPLPLPRPMNMPSSQSYNAYRNLQGQERNAMPNSQYQWIAPVAPIQNPQEIQQAISFYNQYLWMPPIQNLQEIQQAIDFYNQYAGLPPIVNSLSIQQAVSFYNQFARLSPIQNLREIQQAIYFYNQFAGHLPVQNPQEILQAVALYNQNANLPPRQNPQEILQFLSQLYQSAIQAIGNLPPYQPSAPQASQASSRRSSINEVHNCPICLGNIEQRDIRITECMHIFHERCLRVWIETRGARASCPICRANLS